MKQLREFSTSQIQILYTEVLKKTFLNSRIFKQSSTRTSNPKQIPIRLTVEDGRLVRHTTPTSSLRIREMNLVIQGSIEIHNAGLTGQKNEQRSPHKPIEKSHIFSSFSNFHFCSFLAFGPRHYHCFISHKASLILFCFFFFLFGNSG